MTAAKEKCRASDKTFSQYVRGLIRADLEKAGVAVLPRTKKGSK
jgi:hypothetical protein